MNTKFFFKQLNRKIFKVQKFLQNFKYFQMSQEKYISQLNNMALFNINIFMKSFLYVDCRNTNSRV